MIRLDLQLFCTKIKNLRDQNLDLQLNRTSLLHKNHKLELDQ